MTSEEQAANLRSILLAVLIAIAVGLIGFAAAVVNGVSQRAFAEDEVRRNGQLLEQVRMLEEQNNQQVVEHRERNELLHDALCRQIRAVVIAAGLQVRDECPPPLIDPAGVLPGVVHD